MKILNDRLPAKSLWLCGATILIAAAVSFPNLAWADLIPAPVLVVDTDAGVKIAQKTGYNTRQKTVRHKSKANPNTKNVTVYPTDSNGNVVPIVIPPGASANVNGVAVNNTTP